MGRDPGPRGEGGRYHHCGKNKSEFVVKFTAFSSEYCVRPISLLL